MKKLTRYNLGEIYRVYSSDRHSVVCTDSDVAKLEASHAELAERLRLCLEALECLLGLAERHGWLHVAVNTARAAIAKAKEETL